MNPALEKAAIPGPVREVLEGLSHAGFQAFLVGGCVRDLLRGAAPKDFDIATSARPEQVQAAFKKVIPTGLEHGTVTVVLRGAHVEVTTFRAESEYLDGRRPSKVEFHGDIEADLSRRDFTINAMAFDPVTSRLVDPFSGQADLAAQLIRCVRSARERFEEDGLRAMRAVRFATVLGFQIDPQTEAAIAPTLHVFRKVAIERVTTEFTKLLLSPRVVFGLEVLRRTGLLAEFLPEAALGDEVVKAPPELATRLAVLLRDSAAPREVVLRLKLPSKVAHDTSHLVRHHRLPPADASDAQLRRYLASVTIEHLEAVLGVAAALGATPSSDRLRAIAAQRPPLDTKALALNGAQVMAALQVGPSPLIGKATHYLLERVLDEPANNTPEGLQALLAQWSRTV